MYRIKTTKYFEKSVKRCQKRGYNLNLLTKVIELLERDGKLPAMYRPHKLSGNYEGYWECHIQSDWLLLWTQYDEELWLVLTDTGTHSDLFK